MVSLFEVDGKEDISTAFRWILPLREIAKFP